ncbi:hypothetical protein FA048_01980 [Pedobacter polaris]|uniref:Outer membrane protein beta-barrel domain-containing protein n=1 Tax=Pedobacter polaris TaxID=2571273 RepID=A0A4U1CW36_9SPHI|nr:outer membrane beta-barrel protein [Pedobacter polaris]TKC12410.1 hypothetical protein FA048_01980 [Pedobacter polaris]
MKFYIIFFGLFCNSCIVLAQSVKIIGSVQDTSKNLKFNQASVVLVKSKDSIIYADTRTVNGIFTFQNVVKGQYHLIISYPKYVDFFLSLNLEKDSLMDLGTINLMDEAILLNSVVVKGKKLGIKIRGDTTEYDPAAYNLRPNATVEDLLKQLQGMQVDRNGNITAQGKQVRRVLVDGEEFFGNDPTLVTKNLRADMIDKVQVFDKKSDQSAFTGINDGKESKTINLKLKKENKIGNFGRVELAAGNFGFYQGQGFYNHFHNDKKIAAYLFSNNTGIVGLSRRDRQQYSDGGVEATYNTFDIDSWNGSYGGKGIPNSTGLGGQFSNKFNEGKLSMNINYSYNHLNVSGNDFIERQENLPALYLLSNSVRKFDNNQQRNNLNSDLKIILDTSSSLAIKINAGQISRKTFNDFRSEARDSSENIVNSNSRLFKTSADKYAGATDLLYLKKLDRERRTISIGLNIFHTTSTSSGTLISNIETETPTDLNQLKYNKDYTSIINLKSVYTEPLSKSATISATLIWIHNSGALNRETFDQEQNSGNKLLNNSLSNNYHLEQVFERGGLNYYFSTKKIRLQAGTDFAHINFNQKNVSMNSFLKREFYNFYPSAEFAYNFSAMETLSMKYNGYPTLPSIEQLQPIINNNDPLNLIIGNINLDPSFSNNVSLNYIAFKQANNIFISGNVNLSQIKNPISAVVTTDLEGLSIYEYNNLSTVSNLRYSASFSFGAPLKISDISFTVDGSMEGNRLNNIVNSRLSKNQLNMYKLTLGFGKAKKNFYNCGVSFGVIYNSNKNSLQPLLRNESWGYQTRPNLDFYLPFKMSLHTEVDYLFQGKTTSFTSDFSRVLWNTYLQKDFFKNNELSIKVSLNDALNQNRGFERYITQNLVIQNTYDTIKRYFMLSCIWNFKKFNSAK